MKNNIKAEIVAHSKRAETGEEIFTYKLTFPRIILSEVNTYGSLSSRNTSSSRAVPFEKMVEVVKEDPFVPLAWMREHKGMQGTEYLTDPKHIEEKNNTWLAARDMAIDISRDLVNDIVRITYDDSEWYNASSNTEIPNTSLSKNYGNRLLEPFMWVTQLCTATRESFEHLFEQRCPIYDISNEVLELAASDTETSFKSKKDVIKRFPQLSKKDDLWWLQHNKGQAEIHFMDLAEKMYDALNESEPVIMNKNDWHIPLIKVID